MIMPAAVFTLSSFVAKLHDLNQRQRMGADKTLRERLDELNEVVEADDDGVVSPEEYIIFNLKKMGKVDEDTIVLLREQFKALDADGSGSLDVDDIEALKSACDELQCANV